MESSSLKPAAQHERVMKRESRAKPNSLRRFAIFLPWFSRRGIPMQMPLRSVAREFEEWFHPYD
jgi:hypothetical protein